MFEIHFKTFAKLGDVMVVYILYLKSRDKLSLRIAVLFADLPTPNRNRCLQFISEVK